MRFEQRTHPALARAACLDRRFDSPKVLHLCARKLVIVETERVGIGPHRLQGGQARQQDAFQARSGEAVSKSYAIVVGSRSAPCSTVRAVAVGATTATR
jgi:hypothetical protein